MDNQPNNIRVSAKINKSLAFEMCEKCGLLNITQSSFIRIAIERFINDLEYNNCINSVKFESEV